MSPRHLPRVYLLAVLFSAAPALGEEKSPPAAAPAKPPPGAAPQPGGAAPQGDSLSPQTRAIAREMLSPAAVSDRVRRTLREKMKHHGKDWQQLSTAVVLLAYPEVEQRSQHLAIEPRIGQEPGQVAGLGEGFFTLQEDLRTRSNELREAAAAKDPKGVAAAFGRLADTCATCHAVYREQPAAPHGAGPKK